MCLITLNSAEDFYVVKRPTLRVSGVTHFKKILKIKEMTKEHKICRLQRDAYQNHQIKMGIRNFARPSNHE